MPPVAATSTGMPSSESSSRTSKNSLNRPLYDALKIGVTAIRPSAARTASMRRPQLGAREAGQQVVREVAGMVAKLDRPRSAARSRRSRGAAPVASARRSASSRVDDGWLRPAETTTSAALAHRTSTASAACAGAACLPGAAPSSRRRGRRGVARGQEARVGRRLGHVRGLERRELAPQHRHDERAEHLELLEDDRQRQPGVVDEEQLALVVADDLAEAQRAVDDLLRAADGQRRLLDVVLERRPAAVDRRVRRSTAGTRGSAACESARMNTWPPSPTIAWSAGPCP